MPRLTRHTKPKPHNVAAIHPYKELQALQRAASRLVQFMEAGDGVTMLHATRAPRVGRMLPEGCSVRHFHMQLVELLDGAGGLHDPWWTPDREARDKELSKRQEGAMPRMLVEAFDAMRQAEADDDAEEGGKR